MHDDVALVEAIHRTLREVSTAPASGDQLVQRRNQATFDKQLGKWRNLSWDATLTDDEVWRRVVLIPFFGGVRPIGQKRQTRTLHYLGDYREVGQPGWLSSERGKAYVAESKRGDADEEKTDLAYWNELGSKGPRIIAAAANLLDRQSKSSLSLLELLVPVRFRNFRDAQMPDLFSNVRSELQYGFITTFHAMMDLGLPVVKPDTMLVRTAVRLGLIPHYGDPASRSGRQFADLKLDNDEAKRLGKRADFVWPLQAIMNRIAHATGKTVREVDWLFAKMGMDATLEEGREFVVCDAVPKCHLCKARPLCAYATKYNPVPVFKKSKKRSFRIRERKVAEAA